MDKRVLENLEWLQKRLNVCKAIANPARLRILDLLREGETCVCEMVPELGMEQSNVSQHLNILRNAGIVVSRRKGQHVIYSARNPKIFELMDALDDLLTDELEAASDLLRSMENR